MDRSDPIPAGYVAGRGRGASPLPGGGGGGDDGIRRGGGNEDPLAALHSAKEGNTIKKMTKPMLFGMRSMLACKVENVNNEGKTTTTTATMVGVVVVTTSTREPKFEPNSEN